METAAPSPRFSVNRDDVIKILKVAGWTCASALVAAGISTLAKLNVPTEYLWLLPVVNVLLVAIKKFLDGKAAT